MEKVPLEFRHVDRPSLYYSYDAYQPPEKPELDLIKSGDRSIQYTFLQAVQKNNMKAFNNIIKNMDQPQDLTQIKDDCKRTLLHLAALHNNSYLTHHLINLQKKYSESVTIQFDITQQKGLQKWLRYQDYQDNSIAHLAAYNGNIEILKLLQQNEVDLRIKNKKGQTLMHLAAQGNQYIALAFLKEYIRPEISDNSGTTALHQACFSGAEQSAFLLLAWDVDPNLQDNSGFSSLHICALKGYTRITRKLLYRGAQLKLKNNQGLTAIQIAKINNNDEIVSLLQHFNLNCRQTCIRLAVKPSFKLKNKLLGKRSNKYFVSFLILYFLCTAITIFFTIPFVQQLAEIIIYFIVSLTTISSFLYTSLSNPGYLFKQKEKYNIYQLLSITDFDEICVDCCLKYPFRAKHCEFCQRCVMVYDHHCPWLNNCVDIFIVNNQVGSNNHFAFFLFIFNLMITILINIWLNLEFIGKTTIIQTKLTFWSNQIQIQSYQIIFQLFVIILGFGFIIPVAFLIYVQSNNLLLDQTTFERYTLGKVQRGPISPRRASLLQRMVPKAIFNLYICQSLKKQELSQKSIENCSLMCFQNKNNKTYQIDPLNSLLESQMPN